MAITIGRLQRPVDFQTLLAVPSCARSAHFAVHHLPQRSVPTLQRLARHPAAELSTDPAQSRPQAVDDLPAGWWLGLVVPKRHARRSVTRCLLKRQIRVAMQRHAASVAPGVWVVRLRAPLDPKAFASAASAALKQHVAAELDVLFSYCRRKTRDTGNSKASASPP